MQHIKPVDHHRILTQDILSMFSSFWNHILINGMGGEYAFYRIHAFINYTEEYK